MSQFHLLPGQPCHHTLNKGSLSPPYSTAPIPPFSVPFLWLSHTFDYPPRASCQGNIIALISCRSCSIDINTSIPVDGLRAPRILVSLTLLMSSLDHLRGVISASRDGRFSRAWLQLLHHTVEICTRYWSVHYLVEDLGCHLNLAHWGVYYGTQTVSRPLWFSG